MLSSNIIIQFEILIYKCSISQIYHNYVEMASCILLPKFISEINLVIFYRKLWTMAVITRYLEVLKYGFAIIRNSIISGEEYHWKCINLPSEQKYTVLWCVLLVIYLLVVIYVAFFRIMPAMFINLVKSQFHQIIFYFIMIANAQESSWCNQMNWLNHTLLKRQ